MSLRASHVVLALLIVATVVVLVPPRVVPGGRAELMMAVWGMPFEDRLFEDIYARGFEGLHPEVRVRYERYVDVIEKYEAWHVVGRGADVMRMPVSSYHEFVAKGMIAPLTRFINDPDVGLTPAERADFFPWTWHALDVDGQWYALPSDNAQYGLYYNRALFDAHNAAHPEDPLEYPSAAWSWADLRRAADALTVRDQRGKAVQFGVSFDLWAWPFLAFLYQAGGEAWDEAKTTALINSREGVAALTLIRDLVPEDAPIRAFEMADTASGPDDLFKIGKLAMLLDGSWRAPNLELESPELDFAIAPLPRARRRAVIGGTVLWAVSAHSENKRLAWQMIKWLVAREQSLKYWDTLRVAPPALMSVVASEAFKETSGIVVEQAGRRRVLVPPMPREMYPARAAWLEYAITPAPDTGELPGFIVTGPYQDDLERKIAKAMAVVVNGEKTPQAALDEAVAEVHAIIDRDRAAKGLPAIERATW